MIKNTSLTYGCFTKFFHWSMTILFFIMFIIAYIMINIPKSDFRYLLYDFHKATGILLYFLVIMRFFWRIMNIQPSLATSLPFWQHHLAQWNIVAFYCLMFMMPITGFMTSTFSGHDVSFYNIFIMSPLGNIQVISEFFSQAHLLLAYLLISCFLFHIAGVFYHHYYIKDDVFIRMWIQKKS